MHYDLLWWLGIGNIIVGGIYYLFLRGRHYLCQKVSQRLKTDGLIKDFRL